MLPIERPCHATAWRWLARAIPALLLTAIGSAAALGSAGAALPLALPPSVLQQPATCLLDAVHLRPLMVIPAPPQSPAFTLPLRLTFRVSSPFGGRVHPIAGKRHQHTGADLAVPRGTGVQAVAAGTVERIVQTRGGYGRLVVVAHDAGYTSWYAHLDRFAPGLAVGQHVQQGTPLGQVGSSGAATGPHLHLEIRLHDAPLEPLALLHPPAVPAAPGAGGSWRMQASPP